MKQKSTQDTIPKIGKSQLDAVLKFLPVLDAPGYRFGEWIREEGHFPWFLYTADVIAFIGALSENDIIIQFSWMQWEEGRRYLEEPESIQEANLLTLRKLLTANVRRERFCDGHLAGVLENGHIVAILPRLKEIRDDMC